MQRLHIISVGRLTEPWCAEACAAYSKMLSPYFKLSVSEVAAQRLPKNPSAAEIEKSLEAEAQSIQKKMPGKCFTVALCVEGATLSSEELARLIDTTAMRSLEPVFIIGSSHGLSAQLKAQADYKLSLSAMTFAHQLGRVMLMEQLYRCGSILNGGRYHK